MDKRDLARLVDYYRMRVENFEKERLGWLERLEGLRIHGEEFHKLEWETKRRTEEILELQNALAETNLALSEERKRNLHYNNELENAKCNVII
jgi:coiled-coil domain-containing protein 77